MRKKAILAFMLAAALLLTGCALVEKDQAVDDKTPIIQLGDKTITKVQVNNALEYQLSYTSMMYSYYGMSFDPSDATVRAQALEDVITGLTKEVVKEKKAKELSFDIFNEEEDKAIRETAQKDMDTDKESVKANYFADTKLEGDALDTAITEKLKELGQTFDTYYANAKATATEKKLRDSVVSSITVTDEEIKGDYDSRVAEAKTSYESNLSAYGSSVNSNTYVYYAPAGYRYVKHILRKFPDETQTALTNLQTQINDKATQITTVDSSITALGEGVAKEDPKRTDLNAQKAALEQEKTNIQTQYDKALSEAYTALQPKVDEVLGKITAGEDFNTLMETYGEDPGMQTSPQKENGYAVCAGFTSFDPAFTEAAMALKQVGDVSPAVHGQNGIHIIKYVSDIPEGPVALDTVKEKISSELLTGKQDDAYTAKVDEWIANSGVKVFKNNMK
jgi:parvulin-like peptidyl-prolyl isomerase